MTYAKHTERFEIKISAGLKKSAEKKALKKRISVAEYLRSLIEKDIENRS